MDGMECLSFAPVILRAFLYTSKAKREMESAMVFSVVSAMVERIAEEIAVLCMRTATVVASCYCVFVSYVAVKYTHTWAEKLRLLPLFISALSVPLLAKVMIQEKRKTYSVNQHNVQRMDSQIIEQTGGVTLGQKQAMADPPQEYLYRLFTQPMDFDLHTLQAATDNFAEKNKLGGGGLGTVYKGELPGGEEIAVKRLPQISTQETGELEMELPLVVKILHKNLLRPLALCWKEEEKLAVYEYMPNGSLDTHLFDDVKRKFLDFGKRLKIINGIAGGLQYLHEVSQPRMIVRDLKARNVLLDSNFNPKIADFGLAKVFYLDDETQAVTSRKTSYITTENVKLVDFSFIANVFGFGSLTLEIVIRRKSSSFTESKESVDLISLVREHWTNGTIGKLVDPSLGGRFPGGQMQKLVNIALLCVQDNPADRPTMSAVIAMLSGNTILSLPAANGSPSLAHRGDVTEGGVSANQDDEGVEPKIEVSIA